MDKISFLQQFIQTRIQSLSEVKIDAQTLASWRATLNDPDLLNNLSKDLNSYFRTPSVHYVISIVVSVIGFVAIFPTQYSSYNASTQIQRQYQNESDQLEILRSKLKTTLKQTNILHEKHLISSQYLNNSTRLLFLPEAVRVAASGQQVELLSFKPVVSSNQDTQSIPAPANQAPPLQNNQPAPNTSSGQSTISEGSTSKYFSSVSYSLQVRGDYLNILVFLRQLQSFNSYLIFSSSKFTASSSSTAPTGDLAPASSTGEVVLDLTFEVPTLREDRPIISLN